MSKINLSPLEKFLEKHKRTCTFYVYSGDRHCSCGRDEAEKELAAKDAELTIADKLWDAVGTLFYGNFDVPADRVKQEDLIVDLLREYGRIQKARKE